MITVINSSRPFNVFLFPEVQLIVPLFLFLQNSVDNHFSLTQKFYFGTRLTFPWCLIKWNVLILETLVSLFLFIYFLNIFVVKPEVLYFSPCIFQLKITPRLNRKFKEVNWRPNRELLNSYEMLQPRIFKTKFIIYKLQHNL